MTVKKIRLDNKFKSNSDRQSTVLYRDNITSKKVQKFYVNCAKSQKNND